MTAILQALASGLALGAIYGLIALGFNITYATTKTFNFGQGAFLVPGSLVGVSLVLLSVGKPHFGNLSPAEMTFMAYTLATVASVVVVGLIGIALYYCAIKPFVGAAGLNWVLSTIGFGIILQNTALAIWGPASIAVPSPLGSGVYRIAGAGIRPHEVLIAAVAIAVMVGLDIVLRKTRLGKALRAVAFNPQAASIVGINVERIVIIAFVISSALAGLAGILIAPVTTASVFIGLGVALKAFSAAIVGGLTNPRGCMAGGFLLGIIEALVGLWRAEFREIAIFLLIIIVLVIRPAGLFGTKTVEKI
ncbi:MAG: branched-chain amino acid ABC transporter permease [Proteobacteria bacterium]|nr:branched-chain amino acid ABC transporter permease [Pseudomonadota bacterium]